MGRLPAILIALLWAPAANAQLPLGAQLPSVPLAMMQGGSTNSASLSGARGVVFVFWSNDCTWTEGYEQRVLDAARRTPQVSVVLVNSNNADVFPREAAAGKSYRIPYVRDIGAAFARALGAQRTPHVFAFDADGRLVYQGGIDDSPADAGSVGRSWLSDVLSQLAGGSPVTVAPTKAFGCRIRLP